MKKEIHPTYVKEAEITCACGNSFKVGSTLGEIHVEICSECHPFYTGKQKLIDTARRVEKFQEKLAKKAKAAAGVKGRKVKRARAKVTKKAVAKKVEKPASSSTRQDGKEK